LIKTTKDAIPTTFCIEVERSRTILNSPTK